MGMNVSWHATQENKKCGGLSVDGVSREGVGDRFKGAKRDHVHRYCPESA